MQEILDKIIAECSTALNEMLNKLYNSRETFTIKSGSVIGAEVTLLCSTARDPNAYQTFNFRDWYDYFDELKIFVAPDTFEYHNNKKMECRKFQGWILLDGDGRNQKTEDFNSRKEAEWNAFLEAFTIREKQLK